MGVISKGILGGVSGKIGNVVGGNWKSIDYLRSLPASVANPNTSLQQDQRTKFVLTLNFLQPITEFIRVGYASLAIKMTAFNAAFSEVIQNAITGTFPNYAIDFPNVKLAKGNLASTISASCSSTTAATVHIGWDTTLQGFLDSPTDKMICVVYNPSRMEAVYNLNGATRDTGTLDIDVPAFYSGDTVHCYIAFTSPNMVAGSLDRNAISNSVYAGSAQVV
jgi:hypothetical protein